MTALYERWDAIGNSLHAMYEKRYFAQTFTVGNTGANKTHNITSVKLRLRRVLFPGDYIVSIRAVDGADLPTGPDLTSTIMDGNALDTTVGWIEITLPQYVLHSNTKYAIVVGAPDCPGAGTIIEISRSTVHGYTGGTWAYSTDWGVTWGKTDTRDFQFKTYGFAIARFFRTIVTTNETPLNGTSENETALDGISENR